MKRKKSRNFRWFLFLVLLPFVCNSTIIQEKKVEQLKNNIQQAIDYIQTQGETQAFKEFSDPKGKFSQGDYYMFAINYKGVMLAHPWLKIGHNYTDLLDEYGTPIIQLFIETAKVGGGTVGYYWKKPLEETIKFKTSYVQPVSGKEYFVGIGFYE